jgi:Fe-Mn family superoxide dismutase
MTDIPRRSLAAGAGLLVGAMALGTRAQPKKEEAQQLASANMPNLHVEPLTFKPDRIPGLSAKLLTRHHDDDYAGIVKRLGEIEERLVKLDFATTPAEELSRLKRDEHFAYNASILHELYFASLSEVPTRPSGLFADAISRDFGALERWQAEFGATAKSLSGGSGWVMLAYSARDKRLYNHLAADDSMAPAGSTPLLAIDMYEHAYATDFGAKSGAYVDAFLKIVKWPNAERLYREALRV